LKINHYQHTTKVAYGDGTARPRAGCMAAGTSTEVPVACKLNITKCQLATSQNPQMTDKALMTAPHCSVRMYYEKGSSTQ